MLNTLASYIPTALALAAVVGLGYLVMRRSLRRDGDQREFQSIYLGQNERYSEAHLTLLTRQVEALERIAAALESREKSK